MKKIIRGFRRILIHWLPNLVMVAGMAAFIQAGLPVLAFGVAIISKWQVLRGGRKLWINNLHDNACDLVVALSSLILMLLTRSDFGLQVGVAAAYYVWLVLIKPKSGPVWMGVQAAVCQFSGLSVIFLLGRAMPQVAVVALAWLVAIIAADHFLVAHEEGAHGIITFIWGLVVAQLAWLLWRWLILYSVLDGRILIPQAALITTIIGYTFGNIYLDHAQKKLSKVRLAEYVLLGFGLFVAIIIGTQWDTRI